MTLDLTAKQRTHIFLSNLLASLGLNGRVRVNLSERDGYFIAAILGREIAIPSAKRWRNYKRGWERRMARLTYQFGVGEVVKITPGDVVLDVGANVGEFTSALSGMGATVHAIEGDPLVCRCLAFKTLADPRVVRHENVLWNEDTTVTFYSEPTDANSSVFQPMGDAPVKAMQVPAFRLDTLAERHNIGEVAFLKCDAEGAELEVIEGGRELLRRTRAVAFDTGAERMGEETSNACEALLKDLGFTVHHDRRPDRKITFGIRH